MVQRVSRGIDFLSSINFNLHFLFCSDAFKKMERVTVFVFYY
jgi:hypothetical protein